MYIKIFIEINYERSDGYSEYREYIQVWWMNNSGANIGQQLSVCLKAFAFLCVIVGRVWMWWMSEKSWNAAVLTADGCEK